VTTSVDTLPPVPGGPPAGPPAAPGTATASPPPPPDGGGRLVALRWPPARIIALIAFAAVLNFGQAYGMRALRVDSLPPELAFSIRAVVVAAFYSAILAPVVVAARHEGVPFREAVGLRRIPAARALGFGVLASVAARWFAAIWVALMLLLRVKLPGGNIDVTRLFGTSTVGIIATLLLACVVGPFAEEVVFRGVVYGDLRETNGELSALLASGVLFGLLHANAFNLVPLVIVGVTFALAFRFTRSLWTSVIAHGLFNFVSVAVLLALKGRGL
jgi:membrane protease YdiL (CAAX protease family)